MDADAQAQHLTQLTNILERLTVDAQRRDQQLNNLTNTATKIRAVNCKSYRMGEDWSNFVAYFRENVRATHQYTNDRDHEERLNAACCRFIGSKLEAGPTLTAYNNLPTPTKVDWTLLNGELAKLYCNEQEKQNFLAQPGGFKKGKQTMMEYKNELIRLINLYQAELAGVGTEYQRQLVDRFIMGIEDAELRRKLRFHCKRDRMNIDSAYEFAIDYESTEVEEKVKEVAAVAGSHASLVAAAVANPVNPTTTTSTPMRILERSVDPKVKANELGIEQVKAAQAEAQDRVDIFKREVDDKFSGLETRFDRLEMILGARQQQQPQLPPQPRPHLQTYQQPFRHYMQPYRGPMGAGFGRGYRGGRPVAPGLTGGVGFVNNSIAGNLEHHLRPPSVEVIPRTNATNTVGAVASMGKTDDTVKQPQLVQSQPQLVQPQPQLVQPQQQLVQPQQQLLQPQQQFVQSQPQQPQLQQPPLQQRLLTAAATPAHINHPMTDRQQSAYAYNDGWAEYLDYEANPAGYADQQIGTFSYYYPGFH